MSAATATPASTPDIDAQIERLIDLGVASLASLSDDEFRALASALDRDAEGIVVVHDSLVPPSRLAPLLDHEGKRGFVVEDMVDLDAFAPIADVDIPARPLYVITHVERGDDMRNWSPEEALAKITADGRRPLTIGEGISWLLQHPEQLEPNHCFMTIASRLHKKAGLDARTPAIWISGGTGRDGRANRGAPKVGWCWNRNRHTWLGFASTRP
ncbi:DUF5701 family protein [Microbacterium awajiense]